MSENIKITISEEDEGKRLDKVFSTYVTDISRSQIQKLIDNGLVEPKRGSSYKVIAGEEFELTIPEAQSTEIKPENIPLNIVYEDDYLLVINKSADMVVHPGAGNNSGTLVNALLYHCKGKLAYAAGEDRPGIVHRLDKETSGLLVVAKTDEAYEGLVDELSDRDIKRTYNAVVWGVLPEHGIVDMNIGRSEDNRQKMAVADEGGKEAITEYTRIENYGLLASLAECRLQTGRTHQIRVHMAHINNWVVGDPLYGKGSLGKFFKLHKTDENLEKMMRNFPRQALHAVSLEFTHPINKDRMKFNTDLPEDMQELIRMLRENNKSQGF